jgi:hypothetical protein
MGKPRCKRPVSLAQILAWADEHRRRTGAWPQATSGAVAAAPRENWQALNKCLRLGLRGLPGGDTLPRLLGRERGLSERRGRPARPARRLLAARLRARGLTLLEVGRHLGVSRQRAAQLLEAAADPGHKAGRAS